MKHANLKLTVKLAALVAIAALEAHAQESGRPAQPPEQRRIVISIPNRKLMLLEGDRVLRIYDVAVGKRSTPTPKGAFTIVNRVPNPAWYGRGSVVAPGARNPLGSRWMGLSVKGYGIHGTNAPSSIGKAASHGCIRMRKHDVEELFGMVTVGTTVELQGAPTELVAKILADAVTE